MSICCRRIFCLLLITCLPICCKADEPLPASPCSWFNFHGYRFLVGPEAIYVHRKRKGGTKQESWQPGGRCIIEHYRRYCFYWGIEGSYAQGNLNGHTRLGKTLKSKMIDALIEGRFGYTFKSKTCWQSAFTPFIGIGYIWEKNNITKPSQLPLHFCTKYKYATAGFLSAITPFENLTIGLNAKVRYILDPRCRISNDPDFPSTTLKVGNDQLSYRVELPVSYLFCAPTWGVTLMPFYERRYYGGMAAYPHDYIRSHICYYGMTLMLGGYF